MNPADNSPRSLPRYGIGEDEKTRPCVILFDWNGDEEATVRVGPPLERTAGRTTARDDNDDLDDIDLDMFRPRWHGIGRQPGKMALAVVLGVSLTIGVIAILSATEARADAAGVSTLPWQ